MQKKSSQQQHERVSVPSAFCDNECMSRTSRIPRKLINKRTVVGIFLLCFLLTGFYFQRGNQNKEYDNGVLKPQTLLTFLGFQYANGNEWSIEHILSLYTKQHPDVLVSYESIPLSNYFQVLGQRIKMNSMDDIFMVSPYYARQYVAKGRLMDLGNLPILKDFRPEVLEQMHIDGIVPYITNSVGAFGLYCNLRMLNRRNIAVPQNMGMFITACESLRQEGITPLAAGSTESLKAVVIARSFGDALYGDAEKLFAGLVENPEHLERVLSDGLTFLALLRDRGYINVTNFSNARGAVYSPFKRGESPFMIGGTWLSPFMEKEYPGHWFKVFPLPLREDGGIVVLGLDAPLAVNRHSRHLEEALTLVKRLTAPKTITIFNDEQGLFNPLKGAIKPEDKAVYPLWEAFCRGKIVFHSDVRLIYPVWECLDVGVKMILSGASAKEATEKVMQLLIPEEEKKRNSSHDDA